MKTQKTALKMLLLLKHWLRRQKTPAVITILCLVLVSAGCKKNQDALSGQADHRQTVESWYRSFSAGASEKDRQSAEAFIRQLDYSQSTQIERENQPVLVLVKIAGDRNAFFGIAKSDDGPVFDGIYLSKDLANIQQVITTKILPAGNNVLVYDLQKKPVRGWASDASGKLLQNQAMSQRALPSVTKVSTSSVSMSSNWEDCQLVFWITWEISTGKLLSATYLYNTCDNSPTINFIDPGTAPGIQINGGEPVTASEVDQYNEQLRLFKEEVNGAEVRDHEEDESFSTSAVPGDLLTKNWSADWICLKGTTGRSGWNLVSHEIGKLRACALPGHPWAFKSISHHSITFEGSQPPATDISFTQGVGLPSFTEENAAVMYYLAALMQVKFTVTFKYTPIISGMLQTVNQLVNPPETKPYEALGAWKLS